MQREDKVYRDAARLVCGYCDGHFTSWEREARRGAPGSGNWVHREKGDASRSVLCAATGIYNKLAAQVARVNAPQNETGETAAEPEDYMTPLCPVHKRIDELGTLEMEIGGLNCVACSLQERVELLALIAPFADGSKDSVTVLREVADFWATHHGDGRVVVSYPEPSPLAEPGTVKEAVESNSCLLCYSPLKLEVVNESIFYRCSNIPCLWFAWYKLIKPSLPMI